MVAWLPRDPIPVVGGYRHGSVVLPKDAAKIIDLGTRYSVHALDGDRFVYLPSHWPVHEIGMAVLIMRVRILGAHAGFSMRDLRLIRRDQKARGEGEASHQDALPLEGGA